MRRRTKPATLAAGQHRRQAGLEVRLRRYFDAPGYAEASAAVDACERALAAFEAEAFEVEVHPTEEQLARAPWRLRLQDLGLPGGLKP